MIHSIAAPLPQNRTEAFVDRHQAGLWRFLRALGCEAARAEEHCQDALLAALHHGLDGRPDDDARRWLRAAARNLFRMQLRAEGRRPSTVPLDALEAGFVALHGPRGDGSRALDALRGCLDALPKRQRELITQRYERNQPRRALAAAFGLGEAGIKQALRRVRERLRECVQRAIRAAQDHSDHQEPTR